ncbi:MAG: hypothetical protein ACLTDF_03205 [Coprococcus sp.]
MLERNFNMTTDGATLTDIENGKSESFAQRILTGVFCLIWIRVPM